MAGTEWLVIGIVVGLIWPIVMIATVRMTKMTLKVIAESVRDYFSDLTGRIKSNVRSQQ